MKITLQCLAAEMSHAFESATRPGGETFRKLIDGAPGWMTIVCRKAHDDAAILPDDWRYHFIEKTVGAIADRDDIDMAREGLEPDVYTSDLTEWLNSANRRVYYLGEVMEEFGPFKDGFQLLAAAQLRELEETFDQTVAALKDELASRDDENSLTEEE